MGKLNQAAGAIAEASPIFAADELYRTKDVTARLKLSTRAFEVLVRREGVEPIRLSKRSLRWRGRDLNELLAAAQRASA